MIDFYVLHAINSKLTENINLHDYIKWSGNTQNAADQLEKFKMNMMN